MRRCSSLIASGARAAVGRERPEPGKLGRLARSYAQVEAPAQDVETNFATSVPSTSMPKRLAMTAGPAPQRFQRQARDLASNAGHLIRSAAYGGQAATGVHNFSRSHECDIRYRISAPSHFARFFPPPQADRPPTLTERSSEQGRS